MCLQRCQKENGQSRQEIDVVRQLQQELEERHRYQDLHRPYSLEATTQGPQTEQALIQDLRDNPQTETL